MKIKNKYIKKIITSGLIGSLLLNSVPFYSFANNEIATINTNEAGNIKEISPQMIAVLSSLAIGSGITITTNDDIYDIGRLFYDYVKNNNELTWDFVHSAFASGVVLVNDVVHVDNNFLDIVKGFFDNKFSNTSSDIIYTNFPIYPQYTFIDIPSDTSSDFGFSYGGLDFDFTFSGFNQSFNKNEYQIVVSFGSNVKKLSFYGNPGEKIYIWLVSSSNPVLCFRNGKPPINQYDYVVSSNLPYGYKLSEVLTFPYQGGYTWDNVENKKEENYVSLPIPSNLSQLVGQTHNDFWNNTDNLINPCTQEIILPEVENPSINIGESVKLQTDANCSIYNAEDLVTKAEESKNQDDINNARNEVNKLPEGQDKQDLQNRLDAITPNITLSSNSVTANLDVYIKSENSLVMTLDSNSITFDGFSSVEDMVKENTVTVTIKSSLPYELNSYLVQEITSLDDEPKILDKEILNIKANGEDDYNTFNDIGTTPILLLDNQTPGEVNNHGIDFMLDADIPYENGNYKTVLKFEARQK